MIHQIPSSSTPNSAVPLLLVIAGTCVPGPVASLAYRRLHGLTEGQVHVEPIPSLGLGHSARALDVLADSYFKNKDSPVEPVDIVGHSQGGLLALALANRYPDRVRRVITLGAPFQGTVLAWKNLPAAGVRCMIRGSRFLKTMVVPKGVDVHSFFTPDDKLVMPFSSSWLVNATNYYVSLTPPPKREMEWVKTRAGHIDLIFNATVLRRMRDLLCAA